MIKSNVFNSKLKKLNEVIFNYDFGNLDVSDSKIEYIFLKYEKYLRDEIKKIDFRPLTIDFLLKCYSEGGKVHFEIKSRLRDSLAISKRLAVRADSNMFLKLIKTSTYYVLESIIKSKNSSLNIKTLNKELDRICKKCEIEMKFVIGEYIISDIYDNYVEIGLSLEQASKIPDLCMFDYINREMYIRSVLNSLKIRQTPAQVLKYENPLLDDLGIVRSRIDILIMSRYRKSVTDIIEGDGYLLNGDSIAVVHKTDEGMVFKLKPLSIKNYLFK